jgi:hypothetical protein
VGQKCPAQADPGANFWGKFKLCLNSMAETHQQAKQQQQQQQKHQQQQHQQQQYDHTITINIDNTKATATATIAFFYRRVAVVAHAALLDRESERNSQKGNSMQTQKLKRPWQQNNSSNSC